MPYIALLDVDETMIFFHDEHDEDSPATRYNEELIKRLIKDGVTHVFLFTNYSVGNQYNTLEEKKQKDGLYRTDLIEKLKKNGITVIATITNNDLFYRENGQHLTDYDPNEIAANFVPGLYYEKVIRKYEERSSVPGNDLRTDIEYQSDKILANQFKDVKKKMEAFPDQKHCFLDIKQALFHYTIAYFRKTQLFAKLKEIPFVFYDDRHIHLNAVETQAKQEGIELRAIHIKPTLTQTDFSTDLAELCFSDQAIKEMLANILDKIEDYIPKENKFNKIFNFFKINQKLSNKKETTEETENAESFKQLSDYVQQMKTYKAQCIKNEVSDFTLYQKLIQFTLNFRGDLSSILELQTTPTLFKDIDQACAQYVDFAHKILEKNNHYQIVMEEILQRIIADLNPPSNNNNTALANGTTHSISISQ